MFFLNPIYIVCVQGWAWVYSWCVGVETQTPVCVAVRGQPHGVVSLYTPYTASSDHTQVSGLAQPAPLPMISLTDPYFSTFGHSFVCERCPGTLWPLKTSQQLGH